MRILVAGATGYIGSRLVPELLSRGHAVVAASSSVPRPERFSWGTEVENVVMDATDPAAVLEALCEVDAVCYLIHSLQVRGFGARDRLAAVNVRRGVDAQGVRRVVYLSGLVPDVAQTDLSPHIASRLEVEQALAQSSAATLSLRAGVVIGAGSTSFEIVRQTASALLVQPIPTWMNSKVQPIAVSDTIRVLADALESSTVGAVDIGGPDVVSYPQLLATYADLAGLYRAQVPTLGPPTNLTALAAGFACAAPYWTVAALVHSLRHDMVCRPGQPDPAVMDPEDALGLREAIGRALVDHGSPEAGVTSDPAWSQPPRWDGTVLGVGLPGARIASAASHVAEHRIRGLLGLISPG
ncbi:NAD(P)H-binding protein [Nocardioides sp.]|uniref:NAD(P)H-binding protein n=1 Tax=Nocardioides sp. TaxID=35761 RepID=UPI003D0BB08E